MLVATTPLFHAMGIWAVAMERAFGWNRTQLSLALSFTRVEGGILGPIEGYLVDRFGTKRMVLIGMIIMGFGWLVFSQINHLLIFYFSYLVIALGQGLGSWLALNTMMNNWFVRRRSFAMGLSNALARFGSLFFVPLLAWLVDPDFLDRPGWSLTAFVLGIVTILLAFPLASLLRNKPEDYGLLPKGLEKNETVLSTESPSDIDQQGDYTWKQAIRTRAFWLISMGHASTAAIVVTLMVHLGTMLTDRGFSLQTIGWVIATQTGVTALFNLVGGYVGDKIPITIVGEGGMDVSTTDHFFARLWPTRVWDFWINVSSKTIFQSLKCVPESCRAVIDQLDLYDGFYIFKSVFPGHN